MDADQKFISFIKDWARKRNCQFEIENFDGRESPALINGMAVDDVWGWLLQEGETKMTDDNFGCLKWNVENNELVLTWDTCED